MDLKKLTATKSIQLLKNKEISVLEFTKLYIERSKKINKKINSLITIPENEALKRAKYIDDNFEKFKDKKLLGIPISIKDAINTKNILTTAGSKILNNFYPPKNAFVVDKITVKSDAKTGSKLNHNCEVVIFESIGRKFVLFLILICNQKTDNG